MFAPSTIAWAHVWSSVSAAALSASQISFRPSKAGAVSQNSSRLLRSWPSVSGICDVHGGRSFFSGWFRPRVTAIKTQQASVYKSQLCFEWSWSNRFSKVSWQKKASSRKRCKPPGVLPNWSLELTRTLGSRVVPMQPPILPAKERYNRKRN